MQLYNASAKQKSVIKYILLYSLLQSDIKTPDFKAPLIPKVCFYYMKLNQAITEKPQEIETEPEPELVKNVEKPGNLLQLIGFYSNY